MVTFCLDPIEWFWHRAQLVSMGRDMFPNIKEITESTAAYVAARNYMDSHEVSCNEPGSTLVVVVADGI
jgi:hypothetical protein